MPFGLQTKSLPWRKKALTFQHTVEILVWPRGHDFSDSANVLSHKKSLDGWKCMRLVSRPFQWAPSGSHLRTNKSKWMSVCTTGNLIGSCGFHWSSKIVRFIISIVSLAFCSVTYSRLFCYLQLHHEQFIFRELCHGIFIHFSDLTKLLFTLRGNLKIIVS